MLDVTDDILARLHAGAPDTLAFRKLRKRLLREVREAMEAYSMLPAEGA
ncbi:MAG: tRNA 2-thiocytidine(32) synthetase TtcA, partial [Pseudomonadota bacterium]